MDATQPDGPTQTRWFREGYQAAMAEILAILDDPSDPHPADTLESVVVWVRNNAS